MLVSDVIKTALALLDRQDVADMVSSQTYSSDEEASRLVGALLHCFNAVEDELARGFFPLETEETLVASGGKIYYTAFSETPVKILSLTSGGKEIDHVICPKYIEVKAGAYSVKYVFAPSKKELDGESDFTGYPVGERLMAYGVASEYCHISGDIGQAESWESRYRAEIERLRPCPTAKCMGTGRYWV